METSFRVDVAQFVEQPPLLKAIHGLPCSKQELLHVQLHHNANNNAIADFAGQEILI